MAKRLCDAKTVQLVDVKTSKLFGTQYRTEFVEVTRYCERDEHPWGEHFYYLNGEEVSF